MIKAVKMRLEYGMGLEFEKRHAEVWPEVEKMIHDYGGSNCSVFLDERQGVLSGVITVEDAKCQLPDVIPVGTHGNFIRRPEAWK